MDWSVELPLRRRRKGGVAHRGGREEPTTAPRRRTPRRQGLPYQRDGFEDRLGGENVVVGIAMSDGKRSGEITVPCRD